MPAVAARPLYWIAYGALALAIAWFVVASAMAAHYRPSDPARALWWRPHDPAAHDALAQAALDDGEAARARRHALAALTRSPHDATAYRLLGEAAARASDPERARRMFALAGRLTHRDAALASIFFEGAVRERRWDDAMAQADVLIRRAPRSESAVLFRLAVLAREPAFGRALARALAEKPAWRAAFFRELTGNAGHVPAAKQVVAELRAAGGEARPEELSRLLVRLLREGDPAEARRLWAAGLEPAARPALDEVYDPTFTDPGAGGPFGWTVGEHIRSQVVMPAGEQGGVRVELTGIEPEHLLRQALALPPGRYQLESAGRLVAGDPLELRWVVGCAGVAPIPMTLSGPVVARETFEVPEDCGFQYLILSSPGRERDAPSSGVVEHVRVRRLG